MSLLSIGGLSYSAFSMCTNTVLQAKVPPGEARFLVNILVQPQRSMPFSSGSYHYPCGIATTPGMILSVTRAGIIASPRH